MSSPARRSLQSFKPNVFARAWTTSRLLVNGSRPAVTRSGAAKGSRPPHWPAIGCNTGGVSEPEGRGAAWTEERGTSDEGRRRLRAPRRRAGDAAGRRVTMAIEHWAARFTANGVDPADFTRVTSAIDSWDEWCAAWCRAAAEHEDLGRRALGDGHALSGGSHLAQAAVYYHFAKFLFVQDPGQMREEHAAAVRCLNDALPHLSPPGERVEIPFGGATLTGIRRLPAGAGPHPVVVLIPGLDSAKEEVRATPRLFLDRGLATFAVGGPGQGEAED